MLHRTSSHICGRWYLPIFLFRDGLLALIYRASFMVLKRLWSSLPSMVKLSTVASWPEMFWCSYIGGGALRCSFNLSSKFLADSPNIFIITVYPVTLVPVNDPTFLEKWIFVFWGHKVISDGMTTFQMYINPISPANVFIAFTESLMVWNHNVRFWTSGVTGPRLVMAVATAFLLLLVE